MGNDDLDLLHGGHYRGDIACDCAADCVPLPGSLVRTTDRECADRPRPAARVAAPAIDATADRRLRRPSHTRQTQCQRNAAPPDATRPRPTDPIAGQGDPHQRTPTARRCLDNGAGSARRTRCRPSQRRTPHRRLVPPRPMPLRSRLRALADTSPLEVSSGRVKRHRLNGHGDCQLNRALHTIVNWRMLHGHPPTQQYLIRRRTEQKSDAEIRRCLERYTPDTSSASWRPPRDLTSLKRQPRQDTLLVRAPDESCSQHSRGGNPAGAPCGAMMKDI